MQKRSQRFLLATLRFIALVQWVLVAVAVALAQVSTASFLPLVFITILWFGMPKADPASQVGA